MNNLSHHINIQIGKKISARRKELKMPLKEVASFMNVSYQQIQKYENASNKIPAAVLLNLAKKLNVAIDYFYKDIKTTTDNPKNEIVAKPKRPLSILLIEDSSVDEELFKKAVINSKIPCLIHTEHDAKTARDFLYQYKKSSNLPFTSPDIIIMDLNLPGIKGNNLLKELKNNHNFKKIPVIILTNSVNKKDMQECYDNGANAFLTKAFDISEFFQDIKKLLEYWSSMAILPS